MLKVKVKMTGDEIINEIAEVLREGDGEFIANIANRVLARRVTYAGDSTYQVEEL